MDRSSYEYILTKKSKLVNAEIFMIRDEIEKSRDFRFRAFLRENTDLKVS